jgi:cysteine desulfurase
MVIYLDANATTRPAPQVLDAMHQCLDQHWHNPSSIHRPGQEARRLLELARKHVANLLGARTRDLTFTSGGTESIHTALRGLLAPHPLEAPASIVTTTIEHSAIRTLLPQLEQERPNLTIHNLPLLDVGVIDTSSLDTITADTTLVITHWANNETGVIQPINAIGKHCQSLGVPFVVDATQYVGKYPVNLAQLPIDILLCSAHKLHGPKGVGAIATRRGVHLKPSQFGTQELGRRGGTENISGIVGFGAAAQLAKQWLDDPQLRETQTKLRDQLEQSLLDDIPDAVRNSPAQNDQRLWNTINIGFPGVQSEALLVLLSEKGLCASAGAACSSGSLDPSPVLLALGISESIALGSIRLSLSRETTPEEIHEAQKLICVCVQQLRDSSRAALPTP